MKIEHYDIHGIKLWYIEIQFIHKKIKCVDRFKHQKLYFENYNLGVGHIKIQIQIYVVHNDTKNNFLDCLQK